MKENPDMIREGFSMVIHDKVEPLLLNCDVDDKVEGHDLIVTDHKNRNNNKMVDKVEGHYVLLTH